MDDNRTNGAADEQTAAITDQQIQAFVRTLVRGMYGDSKALDQEHGLSFMRALLRRVVDEQVTAIENLGGLEGWARDSLMKLLFEAANIELGQVMSAFAQALALEMLQHASAAPTRSPQSASASPRKRCTNDAVQKSAEIADGMHRFGNYEGMAELYRRGCFRHLEDVAYARVMLERDHGSIDAIAAHLDSSYEGSSAIVHRCDRVFPPS